MVAVKNHRHGARNPEARLRFEITVEQAMSPPLVAEDVADRYTDLPVWVRGVGLGLDSVMYQHKRDMTSFPATVRAARRAFDMAGLRPSDIDVAEVHDFFTGIELMSKRISASRIGSRPASWSRPGRPRWAARCR